MHFHPESGFSSSVTLISDIIGPANFWAFRDFLLQVSQIFAFFTSNLRSALLNLLSQLPVISLPCQLLEFCCFFLFPFFMSLQAYALKNNQTHTHTHTFVIILGELEGINYMYSL